MEQDLQTIETIFRYLENQMDTEEREAFKARLKTDEALKKEFDYYLKTKVGLDSLKLEEFQKNIESWETEHNVKTDARPDNVHDINSGKSRSKGSIFPLLALAASLIAAFLLFWFLLQPSGVLTPAEILASYTPEHKMPLIRDASGSEHRLKEGIQAYMEQRYADAAIFFEAIPATDPQYIDAQMFLGYSKFESDRFNQAVNAFTVVKNANSPRYSYKADWFIALSHLAAGQETEWKANLERIAKDERHEYHKEAIEISGKSF